MERCPNCGAPSRPGAKFCTTCGARFSEDEATVLADTAEVSAIADSPEPATSSESVDGWPSAPDPQQLAAEPAPVEEQATPAPVSVDDAPSEASSTDWLGSSAYTWPARLEAPLPAPQPTETSHDLFFAPESSNEAADVVEVARADPRTQAERLLDELRAVIAQIAPRPGADLDLSGVVSDLEVAVTPPGALAPDDLTELRDALLSARERPRDIDTIVDLTHRLDALVALVIAYDRTLAAIERSLGVLRGAESTDDALAHESSPSRRESS